LETVTDDITEEINVKLSVTYIGIVCSIMTIFFCEEIFPNDPESVQIDLRKTRIAFTSNRTGGLWGDVYSMNTDGSDQIRITDIAAFNEGGTVFHWSPDGTRMVIEAATGVFGGSELYIVSANGTNMYKIGFDRISIIEGESILGISNEHPSWSPDNERIVFTAHGLENNILFVAFADGSGGHQLTDGNSDDDYPAWSPDGEEIIYSSGNNGLYDVYRIDADGKNKRRLTQLYWTQSVFPYWSNSGTMIALEVREEKRIDNHIASDVYIINRDGEIKSKLLDDVLGIGRLVWSPDDQKIAFTQIVNDNYDIFIAEINEAGLFNLTQSPDFDFWPSWSPDGSLVAFESDREGNHDIYIMNSDGTGVINLTSDPAGDSRPSWSPIIIK